MAVPHFQDLPLADRDREWDGTAAEKRVRSWAGADDGPNAKYRDAHVWYDDSKPDNFGSYKLLVADVVQGKLTAVPRGTMAAGGDGRLARWRRPAREGHRPGEVPPREVLREDGRHSPLGALTRAVRLSVSPRGRCSR